MSHELMEHDNVVLHAEPAWHGLGIVVADAPTPEAALQIAGLDWITEQWPVYAAQEGERIVAEGFLANVRADTKHILGIVSKGYKPIQNHELSAFCEALAEQGDMVKVETAGSIRNGTKVWFLLKGESFSVRKTDQITPYICVSNGHDGGTALRVTPTTVRVVCSNTLHMVIPSVENESLRVGRKLPGIGFAHIGDVDAKVAAAKEALGLYGHALDGTRQVIDHLAATDVTREQVQRFFLECYTRDFGAIPVNPITNSEDRKKTKAQDAFLKFATRFDQDRAVAGTTAWNAVNSYTGWLQHEHGRDGALKAASKLFGLDAERSAAALATALEL
jgi:phage/plasmid-like protein (TIGR03299 family)